MILIFSVKGLKQMIEILCTMALSHFIAVQVPSYQERLISKKYTSKYQVCEEIAQTSLKLGVDPILTISIAIEESGLEKGLVSRVGAQGPLQILPQYFCPDSKGIVAPRKSRGKLKGCDLVYYGVKAVDWFLNEYDGEGKDMGMKGALCHYNSGTKCNYSSRSYAKRILLRHRVWSAQIKAQRALGKGGF